MSKRTLLNNLAKVYCRLQPSSHHGVGVFAIRRIPKGINPIELPGTPELVYLSEADVRKQPAGIQKMIRQYAVKQDGHYIYSSLGFNLVELEYFVNHSGEPNLVFDEDEGCYRTARTIAAGEELTCDYNHFALAMPSIRYRKNGSSK